MTSDLGAPAGHEVTDDSYASARQRAEEIQGLYIHMLVFVVVNTALFIINWMASGGDTWWFQWVLLPWGIGLLIHVMVTVFPVFSDEWVERRARRIAAKRSR